MAQLSGWMDLRQRRVIISRHEPTKTSADINVLLQPFASRPDAHSSLWRQTYIHTNIHRRQSYCLLLL